MATITAQTKIWLEYYNFSTVVHPPSASRIGALGRGDGIGYNHETLLIFNLLPHVGTTVTSATLTGTISGFDGRASNLTFAGKVFSQNRKRHEWWNTTGQYDDFNTVPADWDTLLTSITVPAAASGSVVFPSTPALVAEVNKLIAGCPAEWGGGDTRDWQDGIVVNMPTNFFGYYNDFSEWNLTINGDTPATPSLNEHFYRRQRTA